MTHTFNFLTHPYDMNGLYSVLYFPNGLVVSIAKCNLTNYYWEVLAYSPDENVDVFGPMRFDAREHAESVGHDLGAKSADDVAKLIESAKIQQEANA